MNTNISAGAAATTQPEASLKYKVRLEVESLEEIKASDKTKLEHKYAIWALIKQNRQHQAAESYENVIKQIDTFDTVRTIIQLLSDFRHTIYAISKTTIDYESISINHYCDID